MTHRKHWLLLFSAALIMGSVSVTGAAHIDTAGTHWAPPGLHLAEDQPAATDPTAASSVVYHVPTITCAACPLRVEASIRKAPGILEVAFSGQDVTVTYDPSVVTPEAIEAALEAGGDVAEPVAA